jgi:hypothetical protein
MTNAISTGTLGFPRMGGKRELKFALEKYWKGTISEQELLSRAHSVEEAAWKLQSEVDYVTVGDHYLYDSVLSWTEFLGLFPKRFENCKPGLPRMFAMARGIDGAPALSMKKWITSNYHYMVPEVGTYCKIFLISLQRLVFHIFNIPSPSQNLSPSIQMKLPKSLLTLTASLVTANAESNLTERLNLPPLSLVQFHGSVLRRSHLLAALQSSL